MKKQKNQKNMSHVNLDKLAGGAFAEKLNDALLEVAENIQNPNTDATAKRGITINIKFSPSKNRQMVSAQIAVSTKLAAAEAIDTQLIMGMNMKTGGVEIAEYDSTAGQLSVFDIEQEADQDDEKETPPQVEPEQGAQQSGKVLDLRKRRQEREGELKPGQDFDPETGEIYADTIVEKLKKSIQS